MDERIQNAVDIADTYRKENNGEIPTLVIAHSEKDQYVIVGRFRKDERGQGAKTRADQQQFISIMRIIFAKRGITHYEVVTEPEVNNQALQLTQKLLIVVTVDRNNRKKDQIEAHGEFFEIEDEQLTPCYKGMKVASWYTQILPTEFEVELDFKTEKRFDKYFENCLYKLPVEEVEEESAFEELLTGFEALASAMD